VSAAPVIQAAYLVTALCFILGLKRLSHPETARSGNRLAAFGMLVAVLATLFHAGTHNLPLILAGIAAGGLVGAVAAMRVAMTGMPQMVALLNGVGGGSAALVSAVEFMKLSAELHGLPGAIVGAIGGYPTATIASIVAGTLIGSVSFAGSMVAFGKLQGLVTERPVTFAGQRVVNFLLLGALLVVGGMLTAGPAAMGAYTVLLLGALALGIMMVIPIGGADMPVVISLLNAFTGLAAAATGFVLDNYALVVSGTLVGASGTILTQLMCKAMNRSLANVLFSAFGGAPAGAGGAVAGGAAGKTVREITVEDAAILLGNARLVIVIPGYGMAVAQAQHVVRELADALEKRNVTLKYAIHPVAGRMPGHMNVLLAEANVPYPQLFDLDAVNPEFENADVALVVGANDVVNPAARHDTTSPIYGMPILDADKARHVIFMKRSLKPGFAGIDNELYYDPKTMMLFGDARATLTSLVKALKDGG
jgi:NAD(P) transhydrogenase subunit beta